MMITYLKKNYLLVSIFLSLFWVLPAYASEGSNVVHLDTPISEVSYLDIPKKTLELINVRKQIGLFDKIEYGCYQRLIKESKWTMLVFSSITVILILDYFLLGYNRYFQIPNHDILVAIYMTYIVVSIIFFVAKLVYYSAFRYPGFYFLTDKGVLIVHPGASQAIFFLDYNDMVAVNMIPRSGSLSPTNSFLRIVTKEGAILDYTADSFINERAFEQFSMRLKQKLEEQHKLEKPSKKEINGI